jgi:hypothetical protein
MKYKLLLIVAVAAIFTLSFRSIQNDKSPLEKYSTVKVFLNSPNDLKTLAINEIEFEHFRGSIEEGIIIVINQDELSRLKNTGFRYEVTIPDMDEYYKNRPAPTASALQLSESIKSLDNVSSFGYGSMGGYYTYTEVVQKLGYHRRRQKSMGS